MEIGCAQKDTEENFYWKTINPKGARSLCLTDHSVRYIVFHRVLVFLATPMCYISFERVFDVD